MHTQYFEPFKGIFIIVLCPSSTFQNCMIPQVEHPNMHNFNMLQIRTSRNFENNTNDNPKLENKQNKENEHVKFKLWTFLNLQNSERFARVPSKKKILTFSYMKR